MNSPNEDIAAAAIANDQTAQVDLPNESAAADDQDIPVTTRDSEVTHNKDAEASGDPEQEISANDRSRVSKLSHGQEINSSQQHTRYPGLIRLSKRAIS